MAGPVDNRTQYQQALDRANAEGAVQRARLSVQSNPIGKMLGFFTEDAAAQAQRARDEQYAQLIGRDAPYLVDKLAADPAKIDAVLHDPASFARSYGQTAQFFGVDHSRPANPADLPPVAAPKAAVAKTPGGADVVVPTMTPGQAGAKNQIDYISALRSNPALQGLTFRQLRDYVGIQPAPTKPVIGKDAAIEQVLGMTNLQYQQAEAQAQQLEQTDPAKAAELRKSAAQDWLATHMRIAAAPDPVAEAIAGAQKTQ